MNKDSQSIVRGFICLSCATFAMLFAAAAQADTSTGAVTLTQIKGTTNSTAGQIYYLTSGGWPSGEGCDSTLMIVIQRSAPSYDTLSNMLYQAFLNGQEVNFTLSGCTTIGSTTYPIIKDFTIGTVSL